MAMTYARLFASGWTLRAHRAFLWKRIARVWPLYAMVTIAQALLLPGTMIAVLLANLAMIQSWGITRSLVIQGWSISTEAAAYLVFPLLLTRTLFCTPRRAAVTALAAIAVLSALVLLPTSVSHASRAVGPLDMAGGENYAPLVRCLTEFTLGLVAWRVAQRGAVRRLCDRSAFSGTVAVLVIALLSVPGSDLALALAFPVLIVSVMTDRPLVARLLSAWPVHWLGEISYALYLVHIFVFSYRRPAELLAERVGVSHSWGVSHALLIGMAICVAALAHYVIEVPSRRVLLRFSGTRRESSAAEPATLAAP